MGKIKPQAVMKVADMIKFCNENNYSDRDGIRNGRFIRRVFGRNAIEKNLEKSLPQTKKKLEDFVKLLEVQTIRKKKGQETVEASVPMVSIDDLMGFCLKAMEERGLNPLETDIQIGADDGGFILKVNSFFLLFNFLFLRA